MWTPGVPQITSFWIGNLVLSNSETLFGNKVDNLKKPKKAERNKAAKTYPFSYFKVCMINFSSNLTVIIPLTLIGILALTSTDFISKATFLPHKATVGQLNTEK